jgi:hypothetical protein
MPIFEIEGPDGKIYEADAPDAQTAARAFSQMASLDTSKPRLDPAMVQRAHQRASQDLAPEMPWSDVAGDALHNAPGSALNLVQQVAQPFLHPIDTAAGLANLANGLVSKLMPADAESWTVGRRQPSGKSPEEAKAEREASADAVFGNLSDSYGSLEGFKRKLASDPLGTAADVGTVLTLGGSAAASVPGIVGKAGRVARAAGQAIDPVANVTRAVSGVADVVLPKGASRLKDAPSIDDLKAAGGAAYKAADDAGVVIAQPALRQLHAQIADDLTEFGYKPELYPKVRAALDDIEDLAKARVKGTPEKLVGLERFDPAGQSAPLHTTLKGLEQTRRLVNNAGKSVEPSERLLGSRMADRIDDFMDTLDQPGMTVMGDAAKGAASLKEARSLWHQARKSELIEGAIEGAKLRASTTGSGGNVENAIRQELRKLLTDRKKARAFSKEEKQAIRAAAGGTTAQNMMRLLGKLAPSGVVSFGMAATAGNAVGGPVGAAVLPAVGLVAKTAADRGTRLQAEALLKNARAGEIHKSSPRQAPAGAAQSAYQIGGVPRKEEEQKRKLLEILMRRRGQ